MFDFSNPVDVHMTFYEGGVVKLRGYVNTTMSMTALAALNPTPGQTHMIIHTTYDLPPSLTLHLLLSHDVGVYMILKTSDSFCPVLR